MKTQAVSKNVSENKSNMTHTFKDHFERRLRVVDAGIFDDDDQQAIDDQGHQDTGPSDVRGQCSLTLDA